MEFKASGEGTGSPIDRGGGRDEAGPTEPGSPSDSLSAEDGDIPEELRDLPSDPEEVEALFRKYPERRLAWSGLQAGETATADEEAQWLPSSEPWGSRLEAQSPTFASDKLREVHYKKHVVNQQEFPGFGYSSAEAYEHGAQHFIERARQEGVYYQRRTGDTVYYLQETNELAVTSTQNLIRTYFQPEEGVHYFIRQTNEAMTTEK